MNKARKMRSSLQHTISDVPGSLLQYTAMHCDGICEHVVTEMETYTITIYNSVTKV